LGTRGTGERILGRIPLEGGRWASRCDPRAWPGMVTFRWSLPPYPPWRNRCPYRDPRRRSPRSDPRCPAPWQFRPRA
jgi:hypothetical protein